MEYAELQEKAKKLGLPYHRISKEDLEKSIADAEDKKTTKEDAPKENKKDEDASKENDEIKEPAHKEKDDSPEEKEDEVKEPKPNKAIVYKDSLAHIVRTFSPEDHGKDFISLANSFAEKKKLSVIFKHVEAPVVCKNCGAAMTE